MDDQKRATEKPARAIQKAKRDLHQQNGSAMKTNRRESLVKAAVQAYLDIRPDWYGWRQNSGAAMYSDFFVRFGIKGISDFIGLQAMKVRDEYGDYSILCGRFVAIETKREKGGKLSEDQKLFLVNVELFGGLVCVATSVEDVERALGPVQMTLVKQRRERIVPR